MKFFQSSIMTYDDNTKLLLVMVSVGVVFLITTSGSAYAHFNFDIKPGANANHTIRINLGETDEPAFPDDEHNLQFTVTHRLTNLNVGNAHLSQTKPTTQKMFVDTYFYPANVLVTSGGALSPNGGVPPMTGAGCTASGADPKNCLPGSGYTDSRLRQNLSPIPVGDGGITGQYKQATRQFYTEQGKTLYHIYGELNYFNDTGIGPIPINIWTDGTNIKKGSWCEGLAANIANCKAGTSHNITMTPPSGGFGLSNMTSIYWPGSAAGVTENTHPTNIRKAVGSIRDNTFDIWNTLEEVTDALRTVTGFGTVQDHVPRNSTNSGAPSSYTYP
jgi:hypothetical protein